MFPLFTFCLLVISGCSPLRIIVLDDPLSPEEHLNLGVAYEQKGEFDAAIIEYKSAATRLPRAYLYLGNVYFHKHDLVRSEEYYRKAIAEEPADADPYNNLAWLYFTTGEHLEEAETLVLKALELNPSKGDIYRDTLEKITALKATGRERK